MKHPAFRVRNILHVEDSILFHLRNELRQAVKVLPFEPQIEICGSYAIGCARIESDMDINLAAKNWDEQVLWRRIWEDKSLEASFHRRLKPFLDHYSLKIEVAACCPDNKIYNVCYDVKEGRLYGEQGDYTLKWHPYQFRWMKGTPKKSTARYQRDEFEDLVPYYKEIYQDKMIDIRRNEKGELTEWQP